MAKLSEIGKGSILPANTIGWVMPPFPEDGSRDALVCIRSPEFIERLAREMGKGPGKLGLTVWVGGHPILFLPPLLEVPPFNVEIHRHEWRHALEDRPGRPWHR